MLAAWCPAAQTGSVGTQAYGRGSMVSGLEPPADTPKN